MFMRTWSMLDDSGQAKCEPDLFHPEPEPKLDQVPVHYTQLVANPGPVRSTTVTATSKGGG